MDYDKLITDHLNNIRDLETKSGLYLASAHDVPTGYDKAWLRDNFYITMGFESVGEWEPVKKTWRSVLDLFLKHKDKIDWAVNNKPHESWQYIHARYNPETFDEYWDEWGNKQNDAVGAILFKMCECEAKGQAIVETEEDQQMIQKLIDYLNSIQYWNDPDNGVWEEYEELHASSIAPCLAALKLLKNHSYANVHDGMIEQGEEALRKLLPRESETKFADMAQLSLMYPYNVVDREMADQILANIEYHLVKDRGVMRYKTDRYYNKNSDGWSEEAEWTMGFPWLSIIYAQRGDREKAREYLQRTIDVLTYDGKLPELYYSNSKEPNENIPLGWSESLFVVALKESQRTEEEERLDA